MLKKPVSSNRILSRWLWPFFGTTDMKKLRTFLIQKSGWLACYAHLNFLILVLNNKNENLFLNFLKLETKTGNFLCSHKAKGNRSRTIFFLKFMNWWGIWVEIMVQWVPLNWMAVNGIIWLKGSNWTRLTSPKIFFFTQYVHLSSFTYCYQLIKGIKLNQVYQSQNIIFYPMCASSSYCYCYQLVNSISLGLAQSDPIKRRLLY